MSSDSALDYCTVRDHTELLAAPLSPEDQTVQSMPDVSPTKWHRAHTTWFFETFVLTEHTNGYRPYDPSYRYLFNSYYEAVGPRHPRPQRGLLSRPGAGEIADYRRHVDAAMLALAGPSTTAEREAIVELGLHHEQQHQELLLMDIKHVLSANPTFPTYTPAPVDARPAITRVPALTWLTSEGGIVPIGHSGTGFAFDNEGPRHDALVRPYAIADRLVTNGEWLAFIDDGGYRRAELWMSDGWYERAAHEWCAPLYWHQIDGSWHVFSLHGLRPLDLERPVSHISWYEADAFARWAGMRLPTEHEWEHSAPLPRRSPMPEHFEPNAVSQSADPGQWYGELWQWTASPYVAYPGFRPAAGAVGEYNGKFMVNQHVLRGSACVTPPGHARHTYRNFFPASARWPYTGLRLARDTS